MFCEFQPSELNASETPRAKSPVVVDTVNVASIAEWLLAATVTSPPVATVLSLIAAPADANTTFVTT